jgi:hypothetical protein
VAVAIGKWPRIAGISGKDRNEAAGQRHVNRILHGGVSSGGITFQGRNNSSCFGTLTEGVVIGVSPGDHGGVAAVLVRLRTIR